MIINSEEEIMSIEVNKFGVFCGNDIMSYTITNKNGAYVTLLNYGGIISKLCVPDRNGVLGDVVCGFDSVNDYFADRSTYTGSLVGRYANRISDGGFTLDGVFYPIANNESGRWHLHGGNCGFNRRIWSAEVNDSDNSVAFSLYSPHLEEGYPGNLSVKVTYTFDDENALTIRYEAQTDMKTPLNMTNHAYFNLNGYDGGSVLEQELMINADTYDELDDKLIPVGEPVKVEGTEFDFRKMRKIGQGYDHNFQVNGVLGELRLAAEAYDGESGRVMTVYTDLPAVQLYTAGGMNGEALFKNGVPQRPFHAFCLETQYSPNTPNRPYMPQCNITPDEGYDSITRFVFGVR